MRDDRPAQRWAVWWQDDGFQRFYWEVDAIREDYALDSWARWNGYLSHAAMLAHKRWLPADVFVMNLRTRIVLSAEAILDDGGRA